MATPLVVNVGGQSFLSPGPAATLLRTACFQQRLEALARRVAPVVNDLAAAGRRSRTPMLLIPPSLPVGHWRRPRRAEGPVYKTRLNRKPTNMMPTPTTPRKV